MPVSRCCLILVSGKHQFSGMLELHNGVVRAVARAVLRAVARVALAVSARARAERRFIRTRRLTLPDDAPWWSSGLNFCSKLARRRLQFPITV